MNSRATCTPSSSAWKRPGPIRARDVQLAAEVASLEARYRERVKAERGLLPPEEDAFRWMLEELRVSLFAQQLKTRVPVSARRLADAWAEREKVRITQ